MATNSENGHAKLVSNFSRLISFCDSHGTNYSPSNPELKITALQALHAAAAQAIDNIDISKPANDSARAIREPEFKKLNALATRCINTLSASGAPPKIVAQARTIIRKLAGQRAKAITPTAADAADATAKKTISVSQQSYDSRYESFGKLIEFLNTIPEYAPTETELSVAGLRTLHDTMKALNDQVLATEIILSNHRIARNKVLYEQPNSLTTLAQLAKNYIKAKFGSTSSEYKQVSGLTFIKKIK